MLKNSFHVSKLVTTNLGRLYKNKCDRFLPATVWLHKWIWCCTNCCYNYWLYEGGELHSIYSVLRHTVYVTCWVNYYICRVESHGVCSALSCSICSVLRHTVYVTCWVKHYICRVESHGMCSVLSCIICSVLSPVEYVVLTHTVHIIFTHTHLDGLYYIWFSN
jgi:hypothetical protein